jgi:hypothetical protein
MLGNKSNSAVTNSEGDTCTNLRVNPAHVSKLSSDTVSKYDPLPSTLWVNEDGYILDCCAHTQEVFGFWCDELRGRHISMLLPDLKNTSMLDERGISPALAFLCQCVTPFRGVNRAGIGSAYSITPRLISTSVGRGLMLILRSKIY